MTINKSPDHVCFGVCGCSLYELTEYSGVYEVNHIHEILWPDTDFLNDAEMERIEDILNGIE